MKKILIVLLLTCIIAVSGCVGGQKEYSPYCGDKVCNPDEFCDGVPTYLDLGYRECEDDCGACQVTTFGAKGCASLVGSTVCEDTFRDKFPGVKKFFCEGSNCLCSGSSCNSDCTCWY